jgi:adenylate kinase
VNLLALGPQGAGKGTQAKRISSNYDVPHIATGDMFRAAIAAGTPLGKQVEPLLAEGILVPDELTVSLIRERLSEDDTSPGFVLDGFPRNLTQARELDEMLREIGRELDAILFFDVPDSVGMERALQRAVIEGRDDDTREVITRRLVTYHAETGPVVEHYRTTGKLVPIHAARSVDEVWREVEASLRQVEASQLKGTV